MESRRGQNSNIATLLLLMSKSTFVNSCSVNVHLYIVICTLVNIGNRYDVYAFMLNSYYDNYNIATL